MHVFTLECIHPTPRRINLIATSQTVREVTVCTRASSQVLLSVKTVVPPLVSCQQLPENLAGESSQVEVGVCSWHPFQTLRNTARKTLSLKYVYSQARPGRAHIQADSGAVAGPCSLFAPAWQHSAGLGKSRLERQNFSSSSIYENVPATAANGTFGHVCPHPSSSRRSPRTLMNASDSTRKHPKTSSSAHYFFSYPTYPYPTFVQLIPAPKEDSLTTIRQNLGLVQDPYTSLSFHPTQALSRHTSLRCRYFLL